MPGSSMDTISDSQVPLPCEDLHMLMSQNTQLQESGSQLDSAKRSSSSSLLGGSLYMCTVEGRPKVAVEEGNSPDKQDLVSIPDLAKVGIVGYYAYVTLYVCLWHIFIPVNAVFE